MVNIYASKEIDFLVKKFHAETNTKLEDIFLFSNFINAFG